MKHAERTSLLALNSAACIPHLLQSLAASLPANVTVGSVSASLSPVSTFSQWCSTDTECSAAGGVQPKEESGVNGGWGKLQLT